ncbi:protein kinase domain-containing protein [Aquipuribacter nitratireducens]|uniref:non-specific serine/threonine protein kinase n=1 Tax=Aquipuribacter nitratireducens TaxID=650104 RepID=A0ABW0GRM6_9MICO
MTDDPAVPPPDGRLVGGRYRLGRRLGRGGMGAVWQARDEVLDRDVAVKEVSPPPGLAQDERERLRERTLREARAAARIRSTAAVTVYDVVEHDDEPWVVMELLPPRSLADVLREDGPLTPRRAAHVGLRLLEALVAAHGAGVLHRDVKPSNVVFDSRGEAVLTDFGIASLDGDPTVTTTGAIIGSPGYVAPERAHGGPASTASDLWSLGVTLATAVHGRSPFERETPLATMLAAVQDPLPDAVATGPLGAVVSGLLEKDPADRLDAAAARRLLDEVAAAGTDETATQAPPGPVAPAPPLTPPDGGPGTRPTAERTQALRPVAAGAVREGTAGRRRPAVLGVVAAVLGVLLVGAVVAALLDLPGGSSGEAAPAPSATAPSARAEPTAGSAAPEGSEDPARDPDPGGADGGGTDEGDPDGGDTDAGDTDEDGPDEDGPDEDGTARGDGAVPDGFERYDNGRYSLVVPAGWSAEPDGDTRVRFQDPDSRRYLLVEEGGEPSGEPVEDWQAQEPVVAGRLDGYELLGIEEADFRGFEAADWQFTWEPGGGTVRVLNRNVVDERSDRAFALYWQVPVEQWDDSRPLFDEVARSFRPAR